MADIRLASTVVIVRDSDEGLQVLMVLRNKKVGFAGGAWVFPGGAIDPHELALAEDEDAASVVAAVRECQEETGIELEAGELFLFSHWLAPEESPKRFSTWFYLCEIEGQAEVTVDGGEITDHRWAGPAELIAEHRAGKLNLMPPTYVTLLELNEANSVAQVVANRANRPMQYFKPRMVMDEDRVCFLYQEDAGYAAKKAELAGARHRSYLDEQGCHYHRELGE